MRTTFTARSDRGDGLDLRSLRYGSEELTSRLYFAVRDEWWRTVPLTIHKRHSVETGTGFVTEVEAASAWESHPLHVRLSYVADGPSLVAEFTATAHGPFVYQRIGFCLLLPTESFAGLPATSRHAATTTPLAFPVAIVTRDQADPVSVAFHRPFDAIEATLPSGLTVSYDMTGHAAGEPIDFEFEDQRNWTDASYKAYSTSPTRPLTTVEGSVFQQRIAIRATGSAPHRRAAPDARIQLGEGVGPVPPIGLFPGRLSPRSYRPGGGFQELNSRRPDLAGHDSIELAVNGAVHAADDDSVQETTALHGRIVAQTRALYPDLPVRLAPVSFLDAPGDWRDPDGEYAPEPPAGPLPARLYTEFAATWAIASAAQVVAAGPESVHYFCAQLSAEAPAARAVARLAALRGATVLAVTAPAPLAVLAVRIADGISLAVANPGPDAVWFRLPDGRPATLAPFASAWYHLPALPPFSA